MYWEVTEIRALETAPEEEPAGRFVLHRHCDGDGAHFDLRLEHGDCLAGWRIAGERLETGCWATEKLPHPLRWLEEDGDARRENAGAYAWRQQDDNERSLVLKDAEGATLITLKRCASPTVEEVRALAALAAEHGQTPAALSTLAADGLTARARSVERFCGLSRALDSDGFDETGWRRLLAGMTLGEIDERLAKVETRYDRAHPPSPVSRPEPLDADTSARDRAAQAFRIAGE